MSTRLQRLFFLLGDFAAINLASIFFLWMKFVGGTLENVQHNWSQLHMGATEGPSFGFALNYYLDGALPAIYLCWQLLFLFYGLYRIEPSSSRFDEVVSAFKVVTLGNLFFFIATFDPQQPFGLTRTLMFTYWLALFVLVSGNRVAIRSMQRYLLVRGIGQRNAVIVGSEARGVRLLRDLHSSPSQGYAVVGFVRPADEAEKTTVEGVPVLGDVPDLSRLIAEHQIEEVLIALQSNSHQEILEIINAADHHPVSFNITPDLYDIVTGHVRTNQIYGVPLMALKPELMPAWEQTVKRLIDVGVAVAVGLGLLPLWLLICFLIKLESRGPIFFRQERVGRNGKNFTIYKFRSMVVDAEQKTGPVWVRGEDPRVTRMGRILRMLHLDEVPQCINFLKGEMSLVGPRPERPYFVEQFTEQIPFYMRRFNVKPGLLGWAQSKHEFDLDSSDMVGIASERLKFDLYYIENMSLALDVKIMLLTIWFVLAGKSTR
jgi:exopolysaccharide biosynthesis polyprenyl glycosylphosphotransferase